MSSTLFGHLALQFSTHPENLATEALVFILKKSETASKARAHQRDAGDYAQSDLASKPQSRPVCGFWQGAKVAITFVSRIGSLSLTLFLSKSKSG